MFAASIQGGGVLSKASLIAASVQCRPDFPGENLSMGVGPVCWTSFPTGLCEWELGPHHAEESPIQGSTPQGKTYFSRALKPTESIT